MEGYAFLRGQDIYIEVGGRRIAAAQSYRVRSFRQPNFAGSYLEGGGTVVPGSVRHEIELERLSIRDLTGFVDFYDLSGFNVVVKKPGCTLSFEGCEWVEIVEGAAGNAGVLEKVKILSARMKRLE